LHTDRCEDADQQVLEEAICPKVRRDGVALNEDPPALTAHDEQARRIETRRVVIATAQLPQHVQKAGMGRVVNDPALRCRGLAHPGPSPSSITACAILRTPVLICGLPLHEVAASRYHGGIVIPPETAEADKLIRVPIGFPEDLYEWLRETAYRRRSPMAEIVREAVREHRGKLEPQIPLWDAGRDDRP
jgi:hypothetical protein